MAGPKIPILKFDGNANPARNRTRGNKQEDDPRKRNQDPAQMLAALGMSPEEIEQQLAGQEAAEVTKPFVPGLSTPEVRPGTVVTQEGRFVGERKLGTSLAESQRRVREQEAFFESARLEAQLPDILGQLLGQTLTMEQARAALPKVTDRAFQELVAGGFLTDEQVTSLKSIAQTIQEETTTQTVRASELEELRKAAGLPEPTVPPAAIPAATGDISPQVQALRAISEQISLTPINFNNPEFFRTILGTQIPPLPANINLQTGAHLDGTPLSDDELVLAAEWQAATVALENKRAVWEDFVNGLDQEREAQLRLAAIEDAFGTGASRFPAPGEAGPARIGASAVGDQLALLEEAERVQQELTRLELERSKNELRIMLLESPDLLASYSDEELDRLGIKRPTELPEQAVLALLRKELRGQDLSRGVPGKVLTDLARRVGWTTDRLFTFIFQQVGLFSVTPGTGVQTTVIERE